MSDLDARTRALLGAMRSGDDPDQADVDRVGKALLGKLAAAGALAAASVTAPQAAAATGLLGFKLVASGLVVGVALAGGVWIHRSKPAVPAAAAPAKHAAPSRSVPVRKVAEPPRELTATPIPEVSAPAAAASEPAPPKKAPILNVEAEGKLLAEAQRALAAGRTGEALSRLGDYDRRFPKGMLRIEADAARVLALCGAGRQTEGQAQARRFLHRYADSPQASRVERACGAPAQPASADGAATTRRP